jgi:hypothetical protein
MRYAKTILTMVIAMMVTLFLAITMFAEPTEMSASDNDNTYTLAEAAKYCFDFEDDNSNGNYYLPSAEEAAVFLDTTEVDDYIWTGTVGEFTKSGSILETKQGEYMLIRLNDGQTILVKPSTSYPLRCIR